MEKALLSSHQFQLLGISDQVNVLYREGTFIVSIRYYAYKVNLYLLNGFYVEVFYNHKLDKIEKVELMDRSNKRMKFYTDQIKLDKDLI